MKTMLMTLALLCLSIPAVAQPRDDIEIEIVTTADNRLAVVSFDKVVPFASGSFTRATLLPPLSSIFEGVESDARVQVGSFSITVLISTPRPGLSDEIVGRIIRLVRAAFASSVGLNCGGKEQYATMQAYQQRGQSTSVPCNIAEYLN